RGRHPESSTLLTQRRLSLAISISVAARIRGRSAADNGVRPKDALTVIAAWFQMHGYGQSPPRPRARQPDAARLRGPRRQPARPQTQA
ncbi:MAG: hypothetical protein ACXVXW_04540, partial [Mycobacteriaceae bacterium]